MDYTDKLDQLKAWAARLEQTIVDKEAREYFLKLPKFWLGDVERRVVPGVEMILPLIEKQLQHAQQAVDKYGARTFGSLAEVTILRGYEDGSNARFRHQRVKVFRDRAEPRPASVY